MKPYVITDKESKEHLVMFWTAHISEEGVCDYIYIADLKTGEIKCVSQDTLQKNYKLKLIPQRVRGK